MFKGDHYLFAVKANTWNRHESDSWCVKQHVQITDFIAVFHIPIDVMIIKMVRIIFVQLNQSMVWKFDMINVM